MLMAEAAAVEGDLSANELPLRRKDQTVTLGMQIRYCGNIK